MHTLYLEHAGRYSHNTDMPTGKTHPAPAHRDAHRNRVLALAALVQAVSLTQTIARKGMADESDMRACLSSLFADPHTDIAAAYGGLRRLGTGLRHLAFLLQGQRLPEAKELLTHVSGLMALERKLSKRPDMLDALRTGMQRIGKQADYFDSIMHPNFIAGLAGLYGNTISTMKPRIMVHGRPVYLRQSSNTNRIRALLLAGIRAAHLWRQHGGGRLKLLLSRQSMLREIDSLLKEAADY